MKTYVTTDKQKVRVYQIAAKMKDEGLSDRFIVRAVKLAEYYQGAFDLFKLWEKENDQTERDQIIADIQEEIDEVAEQVKSPKKRAFISTKDLNKIADNVVAFKARLKSMVDQWGGVSKLARETGIPQPSLSRFFSTGSMPRRTTLYKIAEALNLSEKEIFADWAA